MKRLTLMRHGDAQWKDPQISDFARPLNRRGIAEADAMARRLVELALVPDLLLVSPAQRTLQTAEAVARELSLTNRHVRRVEALYLARASDVLQIVHTTGPRLPHLMIIGHNPGLSELARQLAPGYGIEGLTTAAICSMTFDTDTWSEIGPDVVHGARHEVPPSPSGLFRIFA
jgi:phosphohistidine phosphatase